MAETRQKLLERLFSERGSVLQAFLQRRVREQPDAADLAQEVYLRMLRVTDLAAIKNPEAYLFAVANNLAKEHARRANPLRGSFDLDDPQVEAMLPELPPAGGDIDRDRSVERLREVLHQLPAKCRAVVALQYWHQQSYQETAQHLGISTNMVKKYLRQALSHCRRRMARLK